MMTEEELQQSMFLLGPWLIGCFLDILFQGVLFCQFTHYFEWHKDDKMTTRLSVIGLALITTLKSIQSFALIWIQLILNFQDLNGAVLLNYTSWWQTGNPLMVATIGAYVQTFFCHRLWLISSKNWWITLPIATVLVFAYISIIVATYYITLGAEASPQIAIWFANHLSTVFAGDLMVTLSTAYFLIMSKKDVLPQTVGLITSLIRLTFQTAAPAAVCAMFNLIFSQVYSGEDKLISTAFNQALPKLYAFSMMWTLNSRHSLRAGQSRNRYTSEQSSGRRRDNVELGHISSYNNSNVIQVHTHTETNQHIDVRGMFHHPVDDVKSRPEDFKPSVM
ncbi:hypothetical protein BDQ12DRAFT_729439 [Crucibulum laeve]|uniref:DUF6534 domain-containing protein n=1 Tax=Crucibulum laeve TaxID=68775 RepID=A0A5C3LS22_9AGAR|nr:hypothetical protein BDQ12DRAFT_729439 [Crucibulum laeve]